MSCSLWKNPLTDVWCDQVFLLKPAKPAVEVVPFTAIGPTNKCNPVNKNTPRANLGKVFVVEDGFARMCDGESGQKFHVPTVLGLSLPVGAFFEIVLAGHGGPKVVQVFSDKFV
jgi:hypothetical protein